MAGVVVGSGPACVCVRVFWDEALKAAGCISCRRACSADRLRLIGLGPQLPQCVCGVRVCVCVCVCVCVSKKLVVWSSLFASHVFH